MKFKVLANSSSVPSEGRNIGYLWTDNWNDWFEYATLYTLTYFDAAGAKHELGGIKIGQFDWGGQQTRPALPGNIFDLLDERFFSLGQDVSYYSGIAKLENATAKRLLRSLKDVVADGPLRAKALHERVMYRSLMRSVSLREIEGQFRRVLDGGVALTKFSFEYEAPRPDSEDLPRLKLDFQVVPDSTPPTNIHVLIGPNGVGKTYLMSGMTRALASKRKDPDKDGILKSNDIFDFDDDPFANVVSVSFSAFDEFSPIPNGRSGRFSNIGLRKRIKNLKNEEVTITLDPAALAEDFSRSARACVVGERGVRWRRALRTLEADSIFEEAQVSSLAQADDEQFPVKAKLRFRNLSSGHKIVLLTITKLVEKVEEKTLVLIDEPEAHLHPPLLSAFVRALSDLLISRNGVAIIATHSPVVLQEVPTSCVWKIVRHGAAVRADRPEIETFAENVGILTREVFGLELSRSGFHRMLAEAVGNAEDIDDVTEKFDNEVGSEGRALISSLLAARKARGAG